jgi:hypothetical protein
MLDDLLALERQGWESLCTSTGADFYGRIMTQDGVMVLAHGQVFDRQAVIDSLNEAPPWRNFKTARYSSTRDVPTGKGKHRRSRRSCRASIRGWTEHGGWPCTSRRRCRTSRPDR